MNVSRRTAELALVAIDSFVLRRSRHNGGAVMSDDLERALVELHAAARADVAPTRNDLPSPPAPGVQWESARHAAERLGVSVRTVQHRAAHGQLAAHRVGRSWLIDTTTGDTVTEKVDTTPEAPSRFRVVGEYLTCRTMAMAGLLPGRSGYCAVGLYRGALLPADAPAEDVQRLLGKNMIEQVPA